MKSSQTIFNTDNDTVTLSRERWEKIDYQLKMYKQLCREMREVLEDES
ncbi:MAG: hypothetical protein J6Y78_04110 [Paludibacteraceae bacterium]|nr:hypothetical protein [Paludibacteraceae bacterium]